MLDPLQLLLVALAAVAGGAVNALAGGGTLITFPMLVAIGLPAVAANVTNTVALCLGYFGATWAQREDLRGQEQRLRLLLPVAAIGGIIGGILLLATEERLFRALVPYLILLAAGLLAVQDPVRRWINRDVAAKGGGSAASDAGGRWAMPLVGIAAIYGGYFGAGLSVIVLAVLGLVIDESLTKLNAIKQGISFSVNVAAAIFFLFSGQVVWPVAAVMAVGALIGGVLGGRLAGKVKPAVLRSIVICIALVVAIIYLVR